MGRLIMYKVVIIDDEPIIVEGLSRSISWDKWQCEVVGTASSGEEGMELIETMKPDILFSDICMPGIDGLTMIAAIKSQHPHMEITILTGFRDFDYAQRAIRLGVTRFLLKPSKMDELEEAVEKMTDNLMVGNILPERKELPEKNLTDGQKLSDGNNLPDKKEEMVEVPLEASVDTTLDTAMEIPEFELDEEIFSEENDEGLDNPAGSFIVYNALHYMEMNYKSKLKLADVAEKCYVSQWHLSKLLNRYKGQSFSDILNNIRIEKAKEMLRDPMLRIGDVAENVGFMDMAHFSRVFKKQVGISANEYRNTAMPMYWEE